ncbi:MAG: hypothetical protein JWN29_2331 [Acidimicrobiales bacterium]|nr:hypothetical protein [Acidimicrobiales bacterium]
MSPRRWAVGVALGAAVAATAVVAAVALPGQDPPPPARTSAVAYVEPKGTGDCSKSAPCSLADALAHRRPGTVLALGSGQYGRLVLDVRVTLRPRAGAHPQLTAVNLRAPGARLEGLRIDGNIMVSPEAKGATVAGSLVHGSIALEADGARLVGNDIGGTTDKDPVQITASPTGVVVEGNRLHDGARGPARGHVDCLQVTSGTNITIRDNDLRQCSNSAVIVKPDLGVIRNVTIEDNRLASCQPLSGSCEGAIALYVRTAAHDIADVLIRGNHIDGSSSFDQIAGLVVERNVLQSFTRGPACPGGVRDNVVRQRPGGACPLGSGNRYEAD